MEHALIHTTWIHDISWTRQAICVDLARLKVMNAPRADAEGHMTRNFETQLFKYYGCEPYW